MRLSDEVRAIVRREGVIARSQHPELASSMARLLRKGDLIAVLPGIYCAVGAQTEWAVRLQALRQWAPDAVLVRRSAAQLTFWPTISAPVVECALKWDRDDQTGYAFFRRRIPAALVVEARGLRVTHPALTALDLCEHVGGDGIDRALRTRVATLAQLREALELTSRRRRNLDRRTLLLDSRDEPWSAAERHFHRLLRSAGLSGWKANFAVRIEGRRYFVDVAFPASRLAIEIDGRLHEDDREIFENDRWRQNALVFDGWTVLRFTWRMLQDHPEQVIRTVDETLRSIRSARRR